MENKWKKPHLGVNYYPEDWPDSEVDTDIAKMQENGIDLVRVAEFAWSKMEPAEGEYQFAWLENLVEKLGRAGIRVILGTPTATPPAWAARKYPDALMEWEDGRQATHGGRRSYCANHPGYRELSSRIVTEMAKRLGRYPNVVGWQVDNEIYPNGKGCFCAHCRREFYKFLQKKYGSIEDVNRAWGTAHLFSQKYDSFEDIPLPRDTWHNPHLLMEWQRFQCQSLVDFVHMQSDIIKKYSDAPVGTDVMPVFVMDYRDMFAPMDVVQFNHYNTPDNLSNVTFWYDYLRTLKQRPFWNTETAANWNGSTAISQSIKPEGYCEANSWLPVAFGGEANLYWLWRTHWAGHELMHGAVLDTCGKPAHVIGEVKRTAQGFDAAGDFLSNTAVQPQAAIHYSPLASAMMQAQPMVEGLDYGKMLIERFHRTVSEAGLRPDVIDTKAPLESYRLIFSPMVMCLAEDGLDHRMQEWVKNGGTWVVGPFTDIRDTAGAKYQDRHFGMLEKFCGLDWLYGIPDCENRLTAATADGTPFAGSWWYDVFNDANPAVHIAGGYSTLAGKGIVLQKKIGKGTVIVLGTFPEKKELARLVRDAAACAGVIPSRTDGKCFVVPRAGAAGCGAAVIEYGNENGAFYPRNACRDLLTGEHFTGRIPMGPYQVRILAFES
jgi:beta-galactosidase GanA